MVMGDQHDRFALFHVQALEKGHDLVGGFTVQVARRFIRKKNLRIRHDRPRNRHALLLSARELAWVMRHPVAQSDETQGRRHVFGALHAG